MSTENTPQWYNSNDRGKYPFATGAALTNGEVFIADNVFADARIFAYGGGYNQYLSKIDKTETQITLYFGDSEASERCFGVFDISSPPTDQITLYDALGRAVGVLVTDSVRLQSLIALAYGVYTFDPDQTMLSPVTITPLPEQGLRSIIAANIAISDEIVFVGGRGITLEQSVNSSGEHVIAFHADGEKFYEALLCQSDEFITLPCFLKTINNIGPDEIGNFSIIAGPGDSDADVDHPCLRVDGSNGSVNIYLIGGAV